MKKIIFLLLSLLSFSVYSQEPTHVKTPKTFQPGNWYMVGNWDSVSGSYKDTIGYYLEGDTIYHWANKQFKSNAPTTINNIFKAVLTNSNGWQFGLIVDTTNIGGGKQASNFSVSKGMPYVTELKFSGLNIVSNTDDSHSAVMQSGKYNSSLDIMYQNIIEARSDGISLKYRDSTGANNELEVEPEGLTLRTNSKERLLIDTNGVSTFDTLVVFNENINVHGTITSGGLTNKDTVISLPDNGIFNFPTTSVGWAEIQCDSLLIEKTWGNVSWNGDGTTTLRSNGAKFVNTDIDGNYACFYDGKNYAILQNTSGYTQTYSIKYHYHY